MARAGAAVFSWLAERAAEGLHVFAYFNNDTGGHAPRDAVRLRAGILERLGVNSQIPNPKSQDEPERS